MLTRWRGVLWGAPVVAAAVASAVLLTRPAGATSGCAAKPSAAWERAYTSHPVSLGALRPTLRIGPKLGDGWVVVVGRRVHRLAPDGTSRVVVTVPAGEQVTHLGTSGSWLALLYEPAGGSTTARREVVVVDTATGRSTTLESLPASNPGLDTLIVTHGSAFWVTRESPDRRRAVGHRYDFATGTRSLIGAQLAPLPQPALGRPKLLGDDQALVWFRNVRPVNIPLRFPLPAPVQKDAALLTGPVVSDGTAYAYSYLGLTTYWRPGMAAPQRFYTAGGVEAVNGPLVALHARYQSGPQPLVLDARTGAVLHVRAGFTAYGGVVQSTSRPGTIYRVEAADLPELRC
ncbi:MAG: hypothetical protein JWO22_2718 [Frankiales bacterium]|nr:hypothetical protein [Frankiales bacterium]